MSTQPLDSAPGNLLVVDDTPANLDLLVTTFKSRGYNVRPAINGRVALKAAEMEPPELILLDINMPEMDGFEVCRRLKRHETLRKIPVIFISALSETLDKVTAFGVGGVDYVTKPFQFDEVEARVSTHLRLRRYQALAETWTHQLAAKVREQTLELRQKNEELRCLVEKIQDHHQQTVEALANLMELQSTRIRSHASQVAEMAEAVAVTLGLPNVEAIRVAGLLHDIGKLGSRGPLGRTDPDTLPREVFAEYSLHPIRGQAAVAAIPALEEVGQLIRHHHEYYAGYGFPDGLKGENIPPGARILGMADYLDWAIKTSTEPEPIAHGLHSLGRELNQKFDPRLFEWFQQLAETVYSQMVAPAADLAQEVSVQDLTPDMVLDQDVLSGTGVLLLRKGSRLSERTIETLKRLYVYDPPKSGIYVRSG